MSFFGFGQSADIDIVLNDAETRKKAEHKSEDGRKDKYFLFYDGETVSGKVNVTLKYPGKRLEHNGIKIEFIGQIGERLAGLRFHTEPAHRSGQSMTGDIEELATGAHCTTVQPQAVVNYIYPNR